MSKEKFVRDKPHVSIAILLVIFSMISAGSLGSMIYLDVKTTSDSDGDSIPDHIEDRTRIPNLYFEVDNESLSYQTFQTEDQSGNHELGHHFGIYHAGATNQLQMELKLYDDVSTDIPIINFGWKYESLIEFFDSDSNGLFEPSEDVIVGQTLLTNLIRKDFGFGKDSQPIYYSQYSTLDGVFNVDFHTAKEHVLLGRQIGMPSVISAGDIKSFLSFSNYSPITGGTKLALNLTFTSTTELVFSSKKVSTMTGEFGIEYEWLNWMFRNGVNKTVNTTIPTSPIPQTAGSIYINFGEVINGTCDPHIKSFKPVIKPLSLTSLPWSYITVGAVVIIMALSVVYARKRPGRVKY